VGGGQALTQAEAATPPIHTLTPPHLPVEREVRRGRAVQVEVRRGAGARHPPIHTLTPPHLPVEREVRQGRAVQDEVRRGAGARHERKQPHEGVSLDEEAREEEVDRE